MFCTYCGNALRPVDKFCGNCGTSTESPSKDVLNTSDALVSNSPPALEDFKTTNGKVVAVRAAVIVALVFFLAVLLTAGIGFFTTQSNSELKQNEVEVPRSTPAPKPVSAPKLDNSQTKAACEYLVPEVESALRNTRAKASASERRVALGSLSIALKRTARLFPVDGLLPKTSVPMKLGEFAIATENLLIAFELNEPSLLALRTTSFIDKLFAAVVEPCNEVGIVVQFPSEQ